MKRGTKEKDAGARRVRAEGERAASAVFAAVLLAALIVTVCGAVARDGNRAFTGALAAALLFLPFGLEKACRLRFPCALRVSAYLFVLASQILGEACGFYRRFAFWDLLLHAESGFLLAAFGFGLFAGSAENGGERYGSPSFPRAFSALCFSVTVGALWELFEFAADRFLHTDMQKDARVWALRSVALGENGKIARVEDIVSTTIWTANGASFSFPGYLDIGLADTMGDLLAGLCGALIFCAIGYRYLKRRRGRLAAWLIPAGAKKREPPS